MPRRKLHLRPSSSTTQYSSLREALYPNHDPFPCPQTTQKQKEKQIAAIVDRYLLDNNYIRTRYTFQAEASIQPSTFPVLEEPKKLAVVLEEYSILKKQKIWVDQERRRLEEEKLRLRKLKMEINKEKRRSEDVTQSNCSYAIQVEKNQTVDDNESALGWEFPILGNLGPDLNYSRFMLDLDIASDSTSPSEQAINMYIGGELLPQITSTMQSSSS